MPRISSGIISLVGQLDNKSPIPANSFHEGTFKTHLHSEIIPVRDQCDTEIDKFTPQNVKKQVDLLCREVVFVCPEVYLLCPRIVPVSPEVVLLCLHIDLFCLQVDMVCPVVDLLCPSIFPYLPILY